VMSLIGLHRHSAALLPAIAGCPPNRFAGRKSGQILSQSSFSVHTK
jgi:hypothetical protein